MPEKIWEIKVVKPFLKHMEKSKPKAHALYSFAFQSYVHWLRKEYGIEKEVDDLTLEDMKPAWIESYVNELSNPHTANSYLSAFKSLFKFVQKEFIPKSMEEFIYLTQYSKGLDAIKMREVPKYFSKEALTEVEVAKLLDAALEDEFMYSAIIVHFYFGARPVELAQRFKEVEIDLNHVGDYVKAYGRAMIDFERKIICLPIAKSKTRVKLIPFDFIEKHMEVWYNNLDVVLKYYRPNAWFTEHVEPYARKAEISKVTAKTARKTFETMWRMVENRQWVIDYLLGHRTSVPDIYSDYNVLMPEIKKTIEEKHYLLKLL